MKKIAIMAMVCAVAAVSCVKEQKAAIGPGQSLYRSKCGACHPKPDPGKFDRAGWVKTINDHNDRVPLEPHQRESLIRFLAGEE